MSLLLHRAHREYHKGRKPLVVSAQPPSGDVNDLAATPQLVKPNRGPLNGWFSRLSKSQPPKKIYKAENALVTADFLAYLGMVPAEAQNASAACNYYSSILEDTTKLAEDPVKPIASLSDCKSFDSTTTSQTGSLPSIANTAASTPSNSCAALDPAKTSCTLFRPQEDRGRSRCQIIQSFDVPIVQEQQSLTASTNLENTSSAIQGTLIAHAAEDGKSTEDSGASKLPEEPSLSLDGHKTQTTDFISARVVPQSAGLAAINAPANTSCDGPHETGTLIIQDKFASLSSEHGDLLAAGEIAVKAAMAKPKKSSRALKKVRRFTVPLIPHSIKAKLKNYKTLKDAHEDTVKKLNASEQEKKNLSKKATDNNMQWQFAKARFDELRYDHEDDAPLTKADLTNLLNQTQDQYQKLEESKKEEVMAAVKELDECKYSHHRTVAILKKKLDDRQVELTQSQEAKDSYKNLHQNVLALLGQSHSDQSIIAAYQSREDALRQEYVDLLQRLDFNTQSRKRLEKEYDYQRLGYGELLREIQDLKDQVCQLSSAKRLLEARAQPIEFDCFPYDQRIEMENMRLQLANKNDELELVRRELRSAVESGGNIDDVYLKGHDHRMFLLTTHSDGLVREIDDLNLKLAIARRSLEDNERFSAEYVAEMEDIKIEKNALEDQLQALKEKLANGEPVDPKSWQHMRECSEGREQALHRQKKAEEREARAEEIRKNEMKQVISLFGKMWRRIFAFEELVHPVQCPDYLIEDRGDLAALSLQIFGINVDLVDPASEAAELALDQQNFGQYRGPYRTPDNWLPMPANIGSQSQANASQSRASTPSTATPPPEHVITDEDKLVAYEESIKSQSQWINNLKVLAVMLWARIWAFEEIVSPEECKAILWDEREGLVQLTLEQAEFDVDIVDPEEEEGLPVEDGPFHTPGAWMPVEQADDDWETVSEGTNSASGCEDSDGSDSSSDSEDNGGVNVYPEQASDKAFKNTDGVHMFNEAFTDALGATNNSRNDDDSIEAASNSDWNLLPNNNAAIIIDRSSKKNKDIDPVSYTKQQIEAMAMSRARRVSAEVDTSPADPDSMRDIPSTSSDSFSTSEITIWADSDSSRSELNFNN